MTDIGGFDSGFSTGFAGGGAAHDLITMINRIAAELGARFDLAGALGSASPSRPNAEAIRNAINTAICDYQKQRFRFNEIDPSNPTTFTTVPYRSTYSTEDSPVISSMYFIDYVNLQLGNTLLQLHQNTPERQHLNIQMFIQYGMPTSYAYEGNTIILYPVPVAAYPIYLGAHLMVAAPSTDTEKDNAWMTPQNGERLIRCRAKFEIATHVTRNLQMAAVMSPYPDPQPGEAYRAFTALKREANKITSTQSRVRPMKW